MKIEVKFTILWFFLGLYKAFNQHYKIIDFSTHKLLVQYVTITKAQYKKTLTKLHFFSFSLHIYSTPNFTTHTPSSSFKPQP